MRRYLVLAALLILSTLVAIAFIGPRLFKSPIARAEERWFEAPRSEYMMTIERQCFCAGSPAYTVTVREGQPTRAVADGRRLSLRDERLYGTTLTVNDLFMLVHELIARHGSENVAVTYDPQWGYPVTIATGGDADTIDDELSLTVTSFQEGR